MTLTAKAVNHSAWRWHRSPRKKLFEHTPERGIGYDMATIESAASHVSTCSLESVKEVVRGIEVVRVVDTGKDHHATTTP